MAFVAGNAPFMALLQGTILNQLQGRVLSLLSTLIGLAAPVGLALATLLGEVIGARGLFVALGTVGALVMSMGFASRVIRQMES